MSRVVFFELPHYITADYREDEACPVYRALRDTAHTLADDCETVFTERMGADDPRAAAFRGHPAIEHDVSAEYTFWIVGAGERADGFGTLSVGVEGDGRRLVAIRRVHEAWQLERYEDAEPAQEAA